VWDGKRLSAFEIVSTLNKIERPQRRRRIDMVENRFVGMKSRGVYESPRHDDPLRGHRVVEQIDPRPRPGRTSRSARPEVAENGLLRFWYHAKLDALMDLYPRAQKPSTAR